MTARSIIRSTGWRSAGCIRSEWRLTDNNRRARYYQLLPAGRSHLRTETANLERYVRALTGILSAQPA